MSPPAERPAGPPAAGPTPEPALVRRARPDDAAAACAALRRSIVECCVLDHRHDPALLDPWLANKTPEVVRGWYERENDYSVVAEQDGVLVGVAALLAAGVVALCYLVPEAHHRGLGARMLAALEEEARRRGLKELTLTSTRTGLPFYLRQGYVDEGPTRSHFGLEARAMRKRLA